MRNAHASSQKNSACFLDGALQLSGIDCARVDEDAKCDAFLRTRCSHGGTVAGRVGAVAQLHHRSELVADDEVGDLMFLAVGDCLFVLRKLLGVDLQLLCAQRLGRCGPQLGNPLLRARERAHRVVRRMRVESDAVDSDLDLLEHAHLTRQSHRLLENRLEESAHLLTSASQRPARDHLAASKKLQCGIGLERSAELRRLVKADEASVDEYGEHSTRMKAVTPERRE